MGAINCQDGANQGICSRHQIKGYPTIMWFGSEKYDKPEVYNGARTGKALDEYALAHIPSYVSHKLTGATLPEFITSSSLPSVVLLTSSSSVSAMYKALSRTYRDRYTFGQIAEKTAGFDALKSQYGVRTLPALVVIHGDHAQLYNGAMKLKEMGEWLKKLATTLKKESTKSTSGSGNSSKKDTSGSSGDKAAPVKELVPLLTAAHVAKITESSSGYTVIILIDTTIVPATYVIPYHSLTFVCIHVCCVVRQSIDPLQQS
jgi:protein disulfide-isomerase A6